MGSVSQIGWEWYSRLARQVRVTLVTHVRNRPALESHGAPIGKSTIVYIDTEWFAGPLYRFSSKLFPKSQHSVFLLSSFDYFVFDRAALRTLKRLKGDWDVVHVATPVSPQAHSSLHRLGKPLIRGPLNGGLGIPKQFQSLLGQDQTWLYKLRKLAKIFDLAGTRTSHISLILAANATTRDAFPPKYRNRVRIMCENGVNLNLFRATPWPEAPSPRRPLRILFAGRLVPFKALPLLLQAVARVRLEFPVELAIAGSGPMEAEWRGTAAELGIGHLTFFLGECTSERIAEELRLCHVFCLPSVRESGGAVLLEAMASARPAIAVAYGGPAELLHERNGMTVPPDSPAAAISGFASGLRQIYSRPEEWRQKGEEGRREAERLYSWEAKIEQACHLYQEVMKNMTVRGGVLPNQQTFREFAAAPSAKAAPSDHVE